MWQSHDCIKKTKKKEYLTTIKSPLNNNLWSKTARRWLFRMKKVKIGKSAHGQKLKIFKITRPSFQMKKVKNSKNRTRNLHVWGTRWRRTTECNRLRKRESSIEMAIDEIMLLATTVQRNLHVWGARWRRTMECNRLQKCESSIEMATDEMLLATIVSSL